MFLSMSGAHHQKLPYVVLPLLVQALLLKRMCLLLIVQIDVAIVVLVVMFAAIVVLVVMFAAIVVLVVMFVLPVQLVCWLQAVLPLDLC